MATDRHAEIAASAAALQDLGPGYDQALAEGLVERIGTEIDQRIAAGIDDRVTAEVDSRIVAQLDRYAGCRHQRPGTGPAHGPGRARPAAPEGQAWCWPSDPCCSPC